MALIKCPECKADVSDNAAACPKCGYALGGSTIMKVVGVAIVLFFLLVLLNRNMISHIIGILGIFGGIAVYQRGKPKKNPSN